MKFGITFESTHLRLLAVGRFEQGQQHQPGASAVVKALPRLPNGLPGPAERSGLISAGSFLIGINGESTLDLTFEETIDRLRLEKRPIRLRFLTSKLPFENACRFAERLQALSLVSALQVDRNNVRLPWVDSVRSAFAHMFTSIFRDFQKYIRIEQRPRASVSSSSSKQRAPRNRRRRSSTLSLSVSFNHAAFCKALPARSREFAREFTQTQSFSSFIDDSVLGRLSHSNCFPLIELFKHCVHLIHELRHVKAAIDLLFERDCTPVEVLRLNLLGESHPEAQRRGSKPSRHLKMLVCEAFERSDDRLEVELESCLAEIEAPTGTPSTVGSSPTCLQALEDEINGIFGPDDEVQLLLIKLPKECKLTSPEVDNDRVFECE